MCLLLVWTKWLRHWEVTVYSSEKEIKLQWCKFPCQSHEAKKVFIQIIQLTQWQLSKPWRKELIFITNSLRIPQNHNGKTHQSQCTLVQCNIDFSSTARRCQLRASDIYWKPSDPSCGIFVKTPLSVWFSDANITSYYWTNHHMIHTKLSITHNPWVVLWWYSVWCLWLLHIIINFSWNHSNVMQIC